MATSAAKQFETYAFLCSLSRKRRSMLEESPELVSELLEAREDELAGTLVIETWWPEVAKLLGSDLAAALTGAGGAEIGDDLGFDGPAKILEAARVSAIAQALPTPMAFHQHAAGALRGDDLVSDVGASFARLKSLYDSAATQGHSMLIALSLDDGE